MGTPLPELPETPVGHLPANPLGPAPAPPVIGKREPLRFPSVGRLLGNRRGRSTRPPLPRLGERRPAPTPQPAPRPTVVQIKQPQPTTPAPRTPLPGRTPAGRPSAEGRREAVDTLLGKDLGRWFRGQPHAVRQKVATVFRERGIDLRAHMTERQVEELNAHIAEIRDDRRRQAEIDARMKQARARQRQQGGRFDPNRPDAAGQMPTPPPDETGGQP